MSLSVVARPGALLVALVLTLSLARLGWAQRQIHVSAALSHDVVEVGESFTVEMTAMAEGRSHIHSPQLKVPAGLRAGSPSIGSKQMVHFGGGRSLIKQGIEARWRVVGEKPGDYTLFSPTVLVDDAKVTASGRLRVKVVPAGSQPRQKRRDPFSGRRSPFGGLFPDFNRFIEPEPEEEEEQEQALSQQGEELSLPYAPQPDVFLRLTADKVRAVVGEQITLRIYQYYRIRAKPESLQEPSLTDFIRMRLHAQPVASDAVRTLVGDQPYLAKLVHELAVFPIRAGKLKTGAAKMPLFARRLGRIERQSGDLEITVREPPQAGRPLGYRIGDVGRFKLAATVAPRDVKTGGSLAVTVQVSGVGALPTSLPLPEQRGVDWLKPAIHEDIVVRGGKIGGTRTFDYAVVVNEPGQIDLGSVELPYYDADRKRYGVARASLGIVSALGDPKGASAPSTGDPGSGDGQSTGDPFVAIAEARTTLSPYPPRSTGVVSPPIVWTSIALPPILVALWRLFAILAAGLRSRIRRRKSDPSALCKQALSDMAAAGDPKDRLACCERAVHLALEATTGLKTRGVLLSELSGALGRKGVASKLAGEVADLLGEFQALRFEPSPSNDATRKASERAQRLVRVLLQIELDPVPASPDRGHTSQSPA